MVGAPLADLDVGLTSWFGLKSRRSLTLGGDSGSVLFVRFRSIEKDVGAASSCGGYWLVLGSESWIPRESQLAHGWGCDSATSSSLYVDQFAPLYLAGCWFVVLISEILSSASKSMVVSTQLSCYS